MNSVRTTRPDRKWFDHLDTTKDYLSHLGWLSELSDAVDSIFEFGCWSPEPLALLWILDASEVVVLEKVARHLLRPKEVLEKLERHLPESLQGRGVRFLPRQDMTTAVLPTGQFDLAFCERVLTNMDSDVLVQQAVMKMADVVKRGGWVIAVESMPDAHGNSRQRTEIAKLFKDAGLYEQRLDDSPIEAYCFRKPIIDGRVF